MRVAVVGAGIMGASTAYRLAQQGVEVHLFDLAGGSAQGVTHKAFGWINTINGDPSAEAAYKLRVRAVEEYESLLCDMPELMRDVRRGSLVWKDSPEATAFAAARHMAQGHVDLVTRTSIAPMEPKLKKLPELAVHSPSDIAISPAALANSFISRAERWGIVLHYGARVDQLDVTGKAVTGICTKSGVFRFDLVVLAAGTHIASLLADIGVSIGIEASPVVILRYRTNERFICNILSFPELEIRQAADRTVLVVEDFHPGCEEMNYSVPRLRITDVLHEYFVVPESFEFGDGEVGHRPMFSDGLPRIGFVQNIGGLYLIVGHPGIILAPLLSRLAAGEIVAHHA